MRSPPAWRPQAWQTVTDRVDVDRPDFTRSPTGTGGSMGPGGAWLKVNSMVLLALEALLDPIAPLLFCTPCHSFSFRVLCETHDGEQRRGLDFAVHSAIHHHCAYGRSMEAGRTDQLPARRLSDAISRSMSMFFVLGVRSLSNLHVLGLLHSRNGSRIPRRGQI